MRNWAGNVEYRARRVHRPSSVDELRRLVTTADRIRALGTRHSFNRIADTDGDLVTTEALPRVIEVNPHRNQVIVNGGIRYGDLVRHLDAEGFALRNLASLPHISIAGACATGTHGSGRRNGSLATSVAAVEFVAADGGLVTLTRGAVEFDGAVVALGALGIVTRLTLDIVPTYSLSQVVYEDVDLDPTLLDEGYSSSIFTDWDGHQQLWVKGLDRPALPLREADGPRHPITGLDPVNCTAQLGEPGPWFDRLPHFRLDFTPSSGDELQSEFFVDADVARPAIEALSNVDIRPVLQISEIRAIAADELWLSPCYGSDKVAFHFTWIADIERVLPVVRQVEEALAPFDARPHWGKVFTRPGRYPRLSDFVALTRRFDPAGKFRNPFLDEFLAA